MMETMTGRDRAVAPGLEMDELGVDTICHWPEPSIDLRPGGAVVQLLTAGEPAQDWEWQTLGRRWALYRGSADRFAGIWSWDLLNDAIRSHRAWPRRLRIVHEGTDVPLSGYSEPVPAARGRHPRARIDGAALRRLLRAGGTLVFGAVNEVLPAVQEIRCSLELAFHTDVTANLYAAWGSDDAFGMHKDQSDSWVLQLAGRKRWLIAEPDRSEPVVVVVQAGDVLYVPQGWGHRVRAMGGETAHITFGVRHPTSREVSEWHLLEEAARATDPGAVLYRPGNPAPAHASPAAPASTRRPSFWAVRNARASALPHVDLPPRALDLGRPQLVRSNLAREARPCASSDHVCVRGAGKRWVFDGSARPLLEELFNAGANGWPVLRLGGNLTESQGRVLAALYDHGLVQREPA